MMKLTIDPRADAAYVDRSDGPVDRTVRLDDNRFVDYGPKGDVIGLEFLDVSRGVDLHDLPYREELVALFQGADIKVYA